MRERQGKLPALLQACTALRGCRPLRGTPERVSPVVSPRWTPRANRDSTLVPSHSMTSYSASERFKCYPSRTVRLGASFVLAPTREIHIDFVKGPSRLTTRLRAFHLRRKAPEQPQAADRVASGASRAVLELTPASTTSGTTCLGARLQNSGSWRSRAPGQAPSHRARGQEWCVAVKGASSTLGTAARSGDGA
jgi:hypothetical protein